MKVKNISQDTLGYRGHPAIRPGDVIHLPEAEALSLVRRNPGKFALTNPPKPKKGK